MERPPFASLLLQSRRAARMTQEELAARAGVGVRTVRDLEAGRAARPQRSTVELLARALGLPGPDRARFFAAARGRPVPLVSLPRVAPLVGRADDVAGVAALLEFADLVTIVGLSGVGKGVLAATVAAEVARGYPGGVGGIRVTEASTEPEILASAVTGLAASHIDELALRATDEAALLVVAGADRSPAAAAAAITWLREQAKVRILATSRHPLGLPGEHQWPLGPLEVPPPDATGAAVFDYPATRLFLDRLRRVRRTPVGEAEAATLGALVRRLGGLPLALELAAARGRVLDIGELLERLGAGPDPAGQTVRTAVLASWDLLTPLEQVCLCWLSVFQRRWSLELAEDLLAACELVSAAPVDVVAVVDRLVELGFVRARVDASAPRPRSDGGTGGRPRPRAIGALRLHVFDAVRQVALDEAHKRGELSAARDQHARVIAGICARIGDAPEGDEAGLPHLLADVEAAAVHLDATADTGGELHRDLVRWLGERGLTR